MRFTRRSALGAGLAAAAGLGPAARAAGEPIVLGVSGPLTGPNAQYGAQWRDGFELALYQVGHIAGAENRPLTYVFEDSQSDPRQAVTIAQKFAADPKIIVELGDFSSPASMAASPIYQRAGLVQFGFTNSHPDFTKGGDHMWSNSISQADEQPKLADYAIKALGYKRLAVIHLNSDWGRTSKDIFVQAAKDIGGTIVATEGILPNERDFRSTLVRVRESKPDALVLIAYYADAALICRQARDSGLSVPFVAVSSVYSPKLIELGGAAVDGVFTQSAFSPDDPRPEVQTFVSAFKARFGHEPDYFNAAAYDSIQLMHTLIGQFGATRDAVFKGLQQARDVPSVIFGKLTFDPRTRRAVDPRYTRLVVKDGRFAVWTAPISG